MTKRLLSLAAGIASVALVLPRSAAASGFEEPAPPAVGRRAANTSTPFPLPPALAPAVMFWREMFTQYDSGKAVLHDRENMQVVWRVLSLPRDKDDNVDERAAQRTMRDALKDLQQRLERLGAKPVAADQFDSDLLQVTQTHAITDTGAAGRRARVQRGVADHFHLGRLRAAPWVDTVRTVLQQTGVPTELVALGFVESMFNPRARSAAGAAGVWQLMPGTARSLGLKVRRNADERHDVLKSTRAAARLLRQNFRQLGSWPLALTAYNHGPNGVKRAIKAIGSNDLVTLIERYEKATWGFASKNFYAEFLAVLAILSEDPQYAQRFGDSQ